LKYLKENYDVVMLDTPPVAVFPDALLLCRHCQELVYVCRWGAVRIGLVRKTLERLAETGVIVRGLVLNRMPGAKLNRYGYESYGSYDKDYYKAYVRDGA
jgi:Mrp family chromosome partitioning ATPase